MFALALVFLLAKASAPPASPVADPQAEGLAALDHNDFDRARQIFSKLAAADPKDYYLQFNLALAETGLLRDAEAITHLNQALALKPGLYEAQLNLGMLHLRDNQPSEAVPFLQAAAKQKPDQINVRRVLAQAYQQSGKFDEAAGLWRQLAKDQPQSAAPLVQLGECLVKAGKVEEAVPVFEQAAQRDPNARRYLVALVPDLIRSQHGDRAIQILKQLPDSADAHAELGRLYLEANRTSDAVPEFEAADHLAPTSQNAQALATAYLRNNQPQLAQPLLEKALVENPRDFDLQMVVGRLYRDQHQYVKAADYFYKAAQLRSESVEAWNEVATSTVLSEQYPQALAALDQVRSLHAEKPGNFYLRAIVLDKIHQAKPALASYQQFLATSEGKNPDEEFKARQRVRILTKEVNR